MTKPTVFISYSHKDEKEKEQLVAHLRILENAGLIELWVDDRIAGGADWQKEIKQAIAKSSVVILLISTNFLNSDFILGKEVPEFLRRRQSEGLTVFPIIAKACHWEVFEWLVKMNVKPKNGTPVWSGGESQTDQRLATITKDIRRSIVKKKARSDPVSTITTTSDTHSLSHPSEEKSLAILRDLPVWRMIGVVVAVITLGWALYTFFAGGEVSGQVFPTQTSAAEVIASTPTSNDTLVPTQAPTATLTTPTSTPSPVPTTTSTDTPTATPTLGEIALAPAETPTPTFISIPAQMPMDTTTPPTSTSTPLPLTKSIPDTGGRIAFTSKRDGNEEIYIMNPDGSEQINLTNNPASDRNPAWSPDGRRILFVSGRENHFGGFWTMNSDGSDLKLLRVGVTSPSGDKPAWSPNGQQIAFGGASKWGDGRQPAIGYMDADGTGWTVITIAPDVTNFQFGYLSWSPDGQRIVFETTKDLYIVNADGNDLTRLTDGRTPAWSPDGQRIAFGGSDGNIYLINPDGTNVLRLTSSGQDSEPCWSPDNKQIAFSSKRDGNLEIYIMNTDGSGQINLTNNPADDYGPNWGW